MPNPSPTSSPFLHFTAGLDLENLLMPMPAEVSVTTISSSAPLGGRCLLLRGQLEWVGQGFPWLLSKVTCLGAPVPAAGLGLVRISKMPPSGLGLVEDLPFHFAAPTPTPLAN